MEKIQSQIEESITGQNLVSEALHAMREYRSWAPSTYNSYRTDCEMYENFMYDNSQTPKLENAKLHLVNKWIKTMQAQQVTPATIQRRLAGLSSIYSFYLDLGIVRSNPFKAIDKPVGESHYHSALLEWDNVKEVFHACKILKSKKIDVELTVKMLFYTGLRNQALTNVKVKHVLTDHGLLQVTPQIVNSKKLPPGLLEQIKIHIEEHKLQPEDSLLYGLEGLPLKEKQLNRITDRINKELNWEGEKRVTPHGFRSSLSTLLSERGVDKVAIKIMIGHDDDALTFQENVWIYIRKYKRFINMIRKELTVMEQQLAGQRGPASKSISSTYAIADPVEEGHLSEMPEFYDESTLIELLKTHPKLAKEIITQGLQKNESPVG
jgi:site-specific recombinase XerD